MAFQFRMIISGLCVVVPDTRFEDRIQSAGSATLLLPNLVEARQLRNRRSDGRHEILDRHFPVLQLGPGTVVRQGSTRQEDRPQGEFDLKGEEIEILPVRGLVTGFEVVGGTPKSTRFPDAVEEKSLFWLPTTEQAAPGLRIKPELLTGEVGIAEPIVTRVKISRGRLRTEELSERSCIFRPPVARRFNQRVAISLALEIDDVPEFVTLSMKKWGERPKTLFLASPPGEEVLTVRLQNLEDERTRELLGALADYEVYYDLLEGFDTVDGERPFLQPLLPDGQQPDTTARALCPPTGSNG